MKMWENGNLHTWLVKTQNGTGTLKHSSAVSLKVKNKLTYDPAISLPGIYSREMKTYVHSKTCVSNVHGSITHCGQKSKNYPTVHQVVKQ